MNPPGPPDGTNTPAGAEDKKANEETDLEAAKIKWGAFNHKELSARIQKVRADKFIIDGLLPVRSIGIAVGRSGLGKSPLLYQMCACVASARPFLGHTVPEKGRVLYIDYENSLQDTESVALAVSRHIGLSEVPVNFILKNINDAPFEHRGAQLDMIRDIKPDLVILDPVSAAYKKFETATEESREVYSDLRDLWKDVNCSVMLVAHPRKPDSDVRKAPISLEEAEHPQDWFAITRGASAIIDGADVRLGLDFASKKSGADLIMRGYVRARGTTPTYYLQRVFDKQEYPLGYSRMANSALFGNAKWQTGFDELPSHFTFTEAHKALGGNSKDSTSKFVKKGQDIGLIRKLGTGAGYEKIPY